MVGVHLELGRQHGDLLDKLEVLVASQLLENPNEWLLVLIVGLGGDIVVLQISSSVEDNLVGLELPLLDISLVSDQDDRDLLADSGEVLVPLGDVLVSDSGGEVEHDDGTLGSDAKKKVKKARLKNLLVDLSELSELLLTGGVPDLQGDDSVVGMELDRGDVHSLSWSVGLLELAGSVSLDKGGLSDSSVSDHD